MLDPKLDIFRPLTVFEVLQSSMEVRDIKIPEALKYPRDIKIPGWCPVGPVLPHEGASLTLVGHPSSDGVTIKMPYGVDGWLKLNLALLLDQLRLA